MIVRWEILLLILACMAVTIIPRILPMLLVNKLKLPEWFWAWLEYIPVSVISALFFREVLLLDGEFRDWHDPYFLAGLFALAVAFAFRSLFLTVCASSVLFTLLRIFSI